jgi:8-oxo-dGTP pyrophosphatase MutT (NUDIX family)
VDNGETPEETARREVREEGGVETALLQLIEKIEYWYVSKQAGVPTRFHKFVHFFLLRYLSGDPKYHDHEVNEARWVEISQAETMLTFESEKKVLVKAKEVITTG